MIFGIIVLLKALGLFDVGFFFWVSLIIIIPCFIGLFGKDKSKWGYTIGICIGLLLMFISFDIIRWGMFGPLCIAGVFLIIGVKMITGKNHHNDNNKYNNMNQQPNSDNNFYGGTNYNSTNGNSNNTNSYYTDSNSNNYYTDSNPNNYNTGSNQSNYSTDSNQNYYNTNGNSDNYGAGGNAKNNYSNSNSSYSFYSNNSYGCYNDRQQSQANQSYDTGTDVQAVVCEKKSEYDNTGSSKTLYSDGNGNTYTGTTGARPENDSEYKEYSAILCGRDINFHNEPFHGAMLTAVLGAIELNLRSAIISKDVNIDAKAVLGGVEIHVPRNAKVVVNCTPVLGGVEDKTSAPIGMINCPTIYINATCVLGGVDVNY